MNSSKTVVSTNGYLWVLRQGGDVDNSDDWDIECADVAGEYRGDVHIDGTRHVLFTDGVRDFAVLPQNAKKL